MKKKRYKLYLVLLVCVLVSGGGLYLGRWQFLKMKYESKRNVEINLQKICEDTKEEINQRVQVANYCLVDSDCVRLALGCPFGCGAYGNKNADTSEFLEMESTYNKKCGTCMYDCFDPPTRELKCVNNKCVN